MSTILLTQPQDTSTMNVMRPIIAADPNEFIVVCPGCGTLETVWCTEDGLLVPTRKFHQYGTQIYHDCGSNVSCRLYRL